MKARLWVRVAKAVARPIVHVLFPFRVIGREHIPAEGSVPLILCCNHISLLDPVFLLLAQKQHIFFMAKEELFKNKLSAWFFRQIGVFPVARGTGDQNALAEAEAVVQHGGIMGIFPEGTRSRTGELLRFKSGMSLIAAKTGASVLPACVVTKHQKVRLFRRTTVVFGEVQSPQALSLSGDKPNVRAATRTLTAAVQQMMEDCR